MPIDLLKVSDAAKILALSPGAVYDLIASGKLDSYRVSAKGKGIRVSRESLDAYLLACKSRPETPPRRRPKTSLRIGGFTHLESGGYVPKSLDR